MIIAECSNIRQADLGNIEIRSMPNGKYAFLPCPQCGKDWHVKIVNGIFQSKQCQQCANLSNGRKRRAHWHPYWKGGRRKYRGYISIFISPESPFWGMVYQKFRTKSTKQITGGYVLEHRLILAQSLNRCLTDNEIVHHKNGIKTDNRFENLHLIDRSIHATDYGSAFTEGYAIGYKDALKGRKHDNL